MPLYNRAPAYLEKKGEPNEKTEKRHGHKDC